jgi:ABC-type bacteriocin/lantibiotic exporter with double-glycine peptidase domain
LQPLSRIITYFSAMLNNLESFKILYNDLKFTLDIKIKKKSSFSVETVKMNNISYSIKSEDYKKDIIKNFDYKFFKGKIYGLYGKSGSW